MKKSDIRESLNITIKCGDLLAACPICKEYLSYNEYRLSNCNRCKKIDFDSITYFPGTNKDNN